ncbi:hypothetical protein NQ317_008769 [Molorchus minor]|uniref:DNA polymerase alpha catalytic subunit N-terminal domain-containing protein n=1 Tax=Molorchus minor TaxID=1323400 RepID=A0ABQ9IUM0_9CUCU|nr:hypothetical protein NQ317_008769 [Molorchus minor]
MDGSRKFRKKGGLKDQEEKLHTKLKLFEKFKQLKSGNRNKYEMEELENVYETVDEKEYVKQVSSRQDDDWIVDDDGSGYVEDGRDIFDDDLDMESIARASAKGKGTKRKKKSVSENAGKGNLQFMLSNMPSKKKEETKIDDDAMLSEILEEIDESPSTKVYNNKPYEEGIENNKETEDAKAEELIEINGFKEFEAVQSQNSEDLTIETDLTQGCFDDDLDMTQIEEFESQILPDISVDETEITNEIQAEFMSEWENIANETDEVEVDSSLDKSNIPLVDVEEKKVFRFYWWDAFEDPEKQKGVVFLFGKTYCDITKCYVSCCVAVRNIDRRLFFLPRPNVLDEKGQPTNEPVTFKMVYNEVNENIMKPLHISSFRARYVHKKFAFDPEVPTESDYMEIRYPASDQKIYINNLRHKPKTFSKVFGANTSFLEVLLLDRKIKGPCWLDIHNPITVSNQISCVNLR